MKTVMEFTISTTCPIDGETIPIDVIAEPFGFLRVEDLLRGARVLTTLPTTQEDFTQKLAGLHLFRSLQTVGTHSGVKITCSA